MSDILLDENSEQVTVFCSNLNVQGHDFLLDSPERRKPNGPKLRRALVHDQNDGLTLNFGNDYPGGVTITGDIQFRISHRDEFFVGLATGVGGGTRSDEIVKLGDVIKTLRQEIADLKTQIAKR